MGKVAGLGLGQFETFKNLSEKRSIFKRLIFMTTVKKSLARDLVGQQETQAAQYTARLFYGPPSEARFDEVAHKKSGGGERRPAWVAGVIIQPRQGPRAAAQKTVTHKFSIIKFLLLQPILQLL